LANKDCGTWPPLIEPAGALIVPAMTSLLAAPAARLTLPPIPDAITVLAPSTKSPAVVRARLVPDRWPAESVVAAPTDPTASLDGFDA